jgi:hypothetical protein
MPRRRRALPVAKLVHSTVVLAIAGVLAGARPWVRADGLPADATEAVTRAMEVTVAIGIGTMAVLAAIALAWNALRLLRDVRTPNPAAFSRTDTL